jgi:hypothetical protein
MRTFRKACASSNPVRTFGSQGTALDPLPFLRKVAQTLASASIALCCVETNLIDTPAESAPNAHDVSLGTGSRAVPWPAIKKAVPGSSIRARPSLRRDLQLALYRLLRSTV